MLLLVSIATILVTIETNINFRANTMSTATGTLSLQDFLPYRLSALSNRISQSLAAKYSSQFNVSVQEWRILAVLGELGEFCDREQGNTISAVAITNKIAMDKVTVSRAVKKLLYKELVIKQIDAKDNRRFGLALTKNGYALYQQLAIIALEYEQQVLAHITSHEQKQLFALLNKLDALDY